MHTELTLPGEEDIYFGLDKHKHKRGELLVVEEGKGEVSLVWGEATCLLLITRAAEYQEFEGCLRVPALGMF